MKKTGVYKFWQVIYPIGIYYVVSSIAYFFLGMLLGDDKETYMMRQMICGALTIPVVLSFFREDQQFENVVYGKDKKIFSMQTIWYMVLSVASGAMLGIAVNNLIAMTPLMQMSEGFQEANHAFFGGEIIYEFLGSCLVIPIAEELLYRGVVFKRLRMFWGVRPAIVLSAVIFGIMHVNLVQFLYAGILGVLLAFLMHRTGKLYAPIWGHIAANVVAIVRKETGWLDFAYRPTALSIGFSLLLLAATAGLIYLENTRHFSSDTLD